MIKNKVAALLMCFPLIFSACTGGDNKSGAVSAEPGDVDIWSTYATEKILQDRTDLYEDVRMPAQVVVEACKGEYESAQIILTASKDVAAYNAEVVADLKGAEGKTFSKENISLRHQKYIEVKETFSDYNNPPTGWYPDALVPLDTIVDFGENKIKKGQNQGVYITFKVLDFPDLTVDGSFALGGAVSAILISNGMNPFITLLFAFLAGSLAGFATGFLNTKLQIPGILAGILTMIALYSINIRVMGNRPNIPLLGMDTSLTIIQNFLSLNKVLSDLLVGFIFSVIIIAIMYWFFGTEMGCAIRATGNNERMIRALGVDTNVMKIIGLMISNALVALSGALVTQSQGYADVGMGTGTIVIGLASVIIGEVVFGNRFSFWYKLASVVMGSIIYRIIIAIVLQLGLKATDLKLLTAIIVAIALSVPVINRKVTRVVGGKRK